MALKFHPELGTILMCDFGTGFKAPEMVKKRPVIVVSPKLKRRSGLCTVIAISTAHPNPVEDCHYKLPSTCLPETKFFRDKESWVKGDMIYRVSFERLDLIRLDKDPQTGKRQYFKQGLSDEQMKEVFSCLLHSVTLGRLTQYM